MIRTREYNPDNEKRVDCVAFPLPAPVTNSEQG